MPIDWDKPLEIRYDRFSSWVPCKRVYRFVYDDDGTEQYVVEEPNHGLTVVYANGNTECLEERIAVRNKVKVLVAKEAWIPLNVVEAYRQDNDRSTPDFPYTKVTYVVEE